MAKLGRFIALISLLFGVAACHSAVQVSAPFDATAAGYILQGGTGRIEGQAFLRRDYGRVVTAAGERVFLIPATPYAVERFSKMFDGDRRSYFGNTIEDTPPDYYRYRRETKIDMAGKFAFENLAPGSYVVATRVFWTEPKSYFSHGGAVYDVVEVKKDETAQAIISGR